MDKIRETVRNAEALETSTKGSSLSRVRQDVVRVQ